MASEITVKDVVKLIKRGCINEYGRVSVHLYDESDACVLDLDCEIEDLPTIVWRERYRTVSNDLIVDYTLPGVGFGRHVDYARQNGMFGYPLVGVLQHSGVYYWKNDAGSYVYADVLPKVFTAVYYDTAFDFMTVA